MSDGQFQRLFAAKDGRHGMAWPTHADEWTTLHRDQYRALDSPGPIDSLPPVSSFTVRAWVVHGDVVPCIKGFDFYSERLHQVVDAHLVPDDEVQWFEFTLVDEETSEKSPWWVCHPPSAIPVDENHSTRGGLTGTIKAVIDPAGIHDRHVFKYPYGFPPVLSPDLCNAIRQAGCTGFNLSPVPGVTRIVGGRDCRHRSDET